MPPASTLTSFARELAVAFEPLRRSMRSLDEFRILMRRLGWVVESLPAPYRQLAERVDSMLVAVGALGDDPSPAEVFDALGDLRDVVAAIRGLDEAPAGVDAPAFLADITRALVELLLADYLARRAPTWHAVLTATGIVQDEVIEGAGGRPTVVRPRLRFEEIPRLLADPSLVPQRVYGWGTADLDFYRVAGDLVELFAALRLAPRMARVERARQTGYQPDPTVVDHAMTLMLVVPLFEVPIASVPMEAGVAILELPAEDGKPAGLVVEPFVPPEIGVSFAISDTLTFVVRAGSDVAETFGLMIRPGEIEVRYPYQPGRPFPSTGFGMALEYAPAAPAVLLGRPSGTRLQIQGGEVELAVRMSSGSVEVVATAETEGLTLVVDGPDPDSFVGSILGNRSVEIPFPLGVRWSSQTGFGFRSGAALSASIAPDLSLGPVRVDLLTVELRGEHPAGAAPRAVLEIGANLGGQLGPIGFTVAGVGLAFAIEFDDGNLGPLDMDVGFKPPTGLGLVIDAGTVTGGGFIDHHPDEGRYDGILQLQILTVQVNAIGLLDTRVEGAPFAFVAVINAEFPDIQLGFGFTLKGLGGALGIHRTVDTDVLQAGLRAHTLDSILFPRDAIARATQVISDLRRVFPPAAGRYVFGPVAKIGWGTPTLVEADIGLILEVPDPVRLILLGQISAALPRKEAPIVELHIDVLGTLDFSRKSLAIDAALHDSRLAAFAIYGDMALRLTWGDQPTFAFSLGGLHPAFQPPPDFPALQRLTVALGTGENPRITLQAYFALTSNTVQFGARAELYAASGGFNLYGWVGFDVLVIFSPFSFRTDFSAGVALRRGTSTVAGIRVNGTLTGATPFHAWGEACLSCFFFDVCVDFDAEFGERRNEVVAARSVWDPLRAAIEDPRSWSARLPARRVVSLLAPPAGAPPLVDPIGIMELHEKVAPFHHPITKFGESKPGDVTQLTVTEVGIGSGPTRRIVPWTPTRDHFAPAQFKDMTDDQKLSSPSFARMDAGVALASQAVAAGAALGTNLVYETKIIDDMRTPARVVAPYQPARGAVLAQLDVGALARSTYLNSGERRFEPPRRESVAGLDEIEYVVVSTRDLAVRDDVLRRASTHGTADAALADYLRLHPEARGQFEVVAVHEANAA
jgi:hypothetical protein